jgi:hypothetical protein
LKKLLHLFLLFRKRFVRSDRLRRLAHLHHLLTKIRIILLLEHRNPLGGCAEGVASCPSTLGRLCIGLHPFGALAELSAGLIHFPGSALFRGGDGAAVGGVVGAGVVAAGPGGTLSGNAFGPRLYSAIAQMAATAMKTRSTHGQTLRFLRWTLISAIFVSSD